MNGDLNDDFLNMATFQDLEYDWSMLCQECPDCWSESDLQLAAELGKTLLERNKELETSLKQHQNIIEDQTQEIEYLTKQTVALREVNDSRLRIYEQLEVSIHDLERSNHRLKLEKEADKKQIKNLYANIATLESKCDELQSTIEDLQIQIDTFKRKQQETLSCTSTPSKLKVKPEFVFSSESSHDKQVQCDNRLSEKPNCNISTITDICEDVLDNDQITQLTAQINDLKNEKTIDGRKITELEDQLSALVRDNQLLQDQIVSLTSKEDDMKSIHEELSSLDEVRQGHLCSRCLSGDKMQDDVSILDTEEEDDDSMMGTLISETRYHSSLSINIQQDSSNPLNQSQNLYRDLIEKYEALVAVNRNHKPLSLQEELQMSGDFNSAHMKDTDEESGHSDAVNTNMYDKHVKIANNRKALAQTPTDFSEAETSSSGFAEETSNKATQTEGRPGSFLCTIADGEDCKFSIYDDASPIDSRFRNRPEYRELFKEIFTVLKKAAENKEEGEELPLLDDCTPVAAVPKVPPVTPATDEVPADFVDDNQSVVSSAVSEDSISINEPATVIENISAIENTPKVEEKKENKEKTEQKQKNPVLTPYKREPLEYISVSVNVRKRSSSKKNNKKQLSERSDSPVIPLSPRINYVGNSGHRRRKENRTNLNVDNGGWNGTTMQFWASNRNVASPTPSQSSNRSFKYDKNSVEFKPSSASHDLHKLKRLDMSYAEVLRNAGKKNEPFPKILQRK